MRPNADHCELLLVGFDQNLDPNAIEFSTYIDITGSSVFIYAYCVKPNLPGIEDSGDDFPALESTIYEKSDVGIDNLIVPLSQETYRRAHNVLVRARTGVCQRGVNSDDATSPISLDSDDFAVQLALFIVFDEFSEDAIMEAFDKFYVQSKTWLYARDYEGIHCLLGVDGSTPYYATMDVSQTRIQEVSPYTFTFFEDVDVSLGGQIAYVEFELQDEQGNTLLKLDSFDGSDIETASYDFLIAGEYQAIYRAYGTPFIASDTPLEDPFELTEIKKSVDVVITAPIVSLESEQQLQWYRQPYFTQSGTSITLLAFSLCIVGGVPILGLLIAYAMSMTTRWLRILTLSLTLLLTILVIFGILTDRLSYFW
jgi:hypothetical protein